MGPATKHDNVMFDIELPGNISDDAPYVKGRGQHVPVGRGYV